MQYKEKDTEVLPFDDLSTLEEWEAEYGIQFLEWLNNLPVMEAE